MFHKLIQVFNNSDSEKETQQDDTGVVIDHTDNSQPPVVFNLEKFDFPDGDNWF